MEITSSGSLTDLSLAVSEDLPSVFLWSDSFFTVRAIYI